MNHTRKDGVERFLNRTREVYLSWGNLHDPKVVRDTVLHRLGETRSSPRLLLSNRLIPAWLIPAAAAADFAFIGIGAITATYVTTTLTAVALEIVLFGSGVSPLLWTLMGLL
jgi:hypothetical protein